MEDKKQIGTFVMILSTEPDGISSTVWVTEVDAMDNVTSFDFINQEAGSVINTLESIYIWISSIGYNFVESEIIAWNFQDLVNLLGVQNENSLWTRRFVDFVSYYAGHFGLSYSQAEAQLMPQVSIDTPQFLIFKLCMLFRLMRARSESLKKILDIGPELIRISDEIGESLRESGTVNRIWGEDNPHK